MMLLIRFQFSLRLNCYEMLWLSIYKADYKAFHRAFTVWLAMVSYDSLAIYVKN